MSRRSAAVLSIVLASAMAMIVVPGASSQDAAQAVPSGAKSEPRVKRPGAEARTTRVFHLSYLSRPTEMQDLVNALRTVGDIPRVSLLPASRTVVVSAPAEQVALAESLINQLDKPNPVTGGDYKLEIRVAEIENGKPVGSKFYTLLMQSRQSASLRARAEVQRSTPNAEAGHPQSEQADFGPSLECTLRAESQRAVLLNLNLELTTLVAGDASLQGASLVRRLHSQSEVEVELGKPTLVTSLDDAVGKKTYQIEVTATRVAPKS